MILEDGKIYRKNGHVISFTEKEKQMPQIYGQNSKYLIMCSMVRLWNNIPLLQGMKNSTIQRTKMVAQVDTLRLLAKPELRENRTARKSNTKQIKKKHTSRLVGGAERTHVAMEGPRLAECGTNREGSPSTSRPCYPTFAQINREGWTQSGGERGQAEQWVAPRGPTFAHR